jgi:hypothetical protein
MARRRKVTTAQLQALIAQLPLSGDTTELMAVARDESYPVVMRMEAPKAALPFHHVMISPADDDTEDE